MAIKATKKKASRKQCTREFKVEIAARALIISVSLAVSEIIISNKIAPVQDERDGKKSGEARIELIQKNVEINYIAAESPIRGGK